MANSEASNRMDLNVHGPRAVALALAVLQQRHGMRVSYEDQVYIESPDVAIFDTPLVQSQQAGVAAWVRIPVSLSLAVSYEVDEEGAPLSPRGVVQSVIEAFNAQTDRAHLESSEGERMIVMGQQRLLAPRPLDYQVVVERQEWTFGSLLDAVCASVAASTGLTVHVGIVPPQLLARTGWFERTGSAREVLLAALDEFVGDTGLSYEALYDETLRWLMINLKCPPAPPVPSAICRNQFCEQTTGGSRVIKPNGGFSINFDVLVGATSGSPARMTVRERMSNIQDGCHVIGGIVVTNPFCCAGSRWPIEDDNTYEDEIFIPCPVAKYFSFARIAPGGGLPTCTMSADQIMAIYSNGQWCDYKTNPLAIQVDATKVTFTRHGLSRSVKVGDSGCPGVAPQPTDGEQGED